MGTEKLVVEGVGEFVVDDVIHCYAAEIDWGGSRVSLLVPRDDVEETESALEAARTILADQACWDRRVRESACYWLLENANDWAYEAACEELDDPDEEPDIDDIEPEEFQRSIKLDSIDVRADGGFDFWFEDNDYFAGHSIVVSGTVEDGPAEAYIAG